jgi:hypothetical protein
MIQLSNMLWLCAIFGAVMGFQRGWNREVLTLAWVVLGTYLLYQFDPVLRGTLLATFDTDQVYMLETALFAAAVFFAYRTRIFQPTEEGGRRGDSRRERTQNEILGAVVGFANGYSIWGMLWYLMDINEYPLAPYIIAPAPNSASAQSIGLIPLVFFGGGIDGTGDLLGAAVIVVFLIVLVVM